MAKLTTTKARKPKRPVLTADMIKAQRGGCSKKRRLLRKFSKLFGEKVTITEALCVKHAEEFEAAWHWLAYRFLPDTEARAKWAELDVALYAKFSPPVGCAKAFARMAIKYGLNP